MQFLCNYTEIRNLILKSFSLKHENIYATKKKKFTIESTHNETSSFSIEIIFGKL